MMEDRATRIIRRPPGSAARRAGRIGLPMGSGSWRDLDPDEIAPVVLVAPGFLTMPGWYDDLAARLRDRGAADVLVAPVYLPDWVLAAVRGLGPIATRVGRALLAAGERSDVSMASRGAPVLLVGHSAGGLIGRLLTSPDPFEGRTLNAAGRIGAIVTLGTPNAAPPIGRDRARWARRVGEAGARFAERHIPGAAFAPTTGYVSVASELVEGRRGTAAGRDTTAGPAITPGPATTPGRDGFVRRIYEDVYPQPDLEAVAGDGLIPMAAALLPGSHQVVLADATHGPARHSTWYGSPTSLDAWWPVALAAWKDALRARLGAGPSGQ